ncbi:MAG: DUF4330 family protein [Clostridia bacterium]|nr:DUF4330 family protein [Clostridia bacterium]
MQPRGRYVKLNAVDYILIVSLVLLLLTLPIRGILYFRNTTESHACEASVEFVIRRVDEATVGTLQMGDASFCMPDGATLPQTKVSKIAHTVEYVPNEDGDMEGLESSTVYDVHFTFRAEGARAKDGTFLLFGSRRLSVGESLLLSRASHSYTADFVSVQIS